jgi:hypothetical protein
LVGQLRTLETPNLNVVYSDDTGDLLLHNFDTELVIHVDVIPTVNRSILEHYAVVLNTLFEQLKERDIPSVKAWVLTDEQIRYAVFFGFQLTGKEIKLKGYYGPTIYELEKVLN